MCGVYIYVCMYVLCDARVYVYVCVCARVCMYIGTYIMCICSPVSFNHLNISFDYSFAMCIRT